MEDLDRLRSVALANGDVITRTDEAFLQRFLYARKHNVDAAAILLLKYFKFQQQHAALFVNFSAKFLWPIFQTGFLGVLPSPTKSGSVVLVLRCRHIDLKKYFFHEYKRAIMFLCEHLIESEQAQKHGFVVLEDFEGFHIPFGRRMGDDSIRSVVDWLQECFPARFKAVHCIRQPWYMTAVWAVVKPFLGHKLKKKIVLHGSDKSAVLSLFTMASDVPIEFGGTLAFDSLSSISWIEKQYHVEMEA
eukprot:GILJ01005808.1.p1 GENE.GILJ01005808.1~~GILJ01005808.1.p1  ORF type:complete len:246 (-),score=34.94 GILJ01005808.1:252-989(-)